MPVGTTFPGYNNLKKNGWGGEENTLIVYKSLLKSAEMTYFLLLVQKRIHNFELIFKLKKCMCAYILYRNIIIGLGENNYG